MAYQIEKETGDIVIGGFELGIQPSPHKGIANIQNANISTEQSEIMASFSRVQQSQSIITSGTLTASSGLGSFYLAPGTSLTVGNWITVSSSSITSISTTTYYVTFQSSGNVQLASTFGGSAISHGTSGTATYSTAFNMGNPVAYTIEPYFDTAQQYRYYVLDSNGRVWVYDTAVYASSLFLSGVGTTWFLPNSDVTYFSGGTVPSGIAVLNGELMVFGGATIYCKPTVNLAGNYANFYNGGMTSLATGTTPHFAFVGHQGRCYYTDGVYIGSIFPDSSLPGVVSRANIQSYVKYTGSTTTGTVSAVIDGSLPTNGLPTGSGGYRIPAFFFTDINGVQPTNLVLGTRYWIEMNNGATTFQVFAAETGGAAINVATGASGNQYFNTFWPVSTNGAESQVYSPQRVNLPEFEQAQCMAEIGNNVIIGTLSNILYPWNQVDPTPSSIIALPENRTFNIITVNQMAYVFAGYKGNVYITDANTASLVIKVSDYCAGIEGTTGSYYEPVFTWGGAAYIRGRVYFSILDQVSGKAGNCGGIWSFIPTQNLYIGQDTGLALRLENQNSYGTYNGVATLIIPSQQQNVQAPQYWAAWYSNITAPTYGIDYTNTTPNGLYSVETDLIPVGTLLSKFTPKQIEYKLAAPLVSGESVQIYWRKNATDVFATCGSVILPDGALSVAGYFNANFQGAQWIQLKFTGLPQTSASSSFVRLNEIRIR